MKGLFVLSAVLFAALGAQADGFRCEELNGNLKIKVYNKVNADEGTRNASVMILSDSNISDGLKTIATFAADAGLLSNEGLVYTAKVDLRFSGSARKGEYLLGTRLGDVDSLTLDVSSFNYAHPAENGSEFPAQLSLLKRNGEISSVNMVCERYLKN